MIAIELKKQASHAGFLLMIGIIYANTLAAPIDGVIVGVNNKPIKDALVYSQNPERSNLEDKAHYAFSNEKGRFQLEAQSQLLFISHPDFHAKIVDLTKAKKTRIFKLQPLQKRDRLFSYCAIDSIGTQLRKYLQLPIDEAVTIKCEEDEGIKRCVVYQVGLQDASKMVITVGRAYTFGFPAEQLVLNSTSYTIRSFRAGKLSGIDVRGVVKDKGIWRFVSLESSVVIKYSEASKETSKMFDNLINRICVPNS